MLIMIVLTDKHNAIEHSNKLVTLSTLNVMIDVIGVGNGHLLWPNDHCISEEYMNEPYSLSHKTSFFFFKSELHAQSLLGKVDYFK